MEITITLRDTENGQVEIEETRLPYSQETAQSVTTASVLADELGERVEQLGEVTSSGIPVLDDGKYDLKGG